MIKDVLELYNNNNNNNRSFLWFGILESHRPNIIKWKDVCKPKKVGGLDIRDIHVWNQIEMGKTAWHIHRIKDSLWVRCAQPTASWKMKKLYSYKGHGKMDFL